jgi:ketosteroid isomerase-like protein
VAKKRSAKKRPAKKASRAKSKKKGGAKKPAAGGLASLARKMLRMTQLPNFGEAEIRALYAEDCISEEGTGQVDRGHSGLAAKGKRWEQMQSGTKWNARNVWVGPKTVCIEWDATVNLRDGRTVRLREIGVHEIKGGKIQNERFYYNPLVLAPPQS